jgi:hypothetical protein
MYGVTASNGSEVSIKGKGCIRNAEAKDGSKIKIDS